MSEPTYLIRFRKALEKRGNLAEKFKNRVLAVTRSAQYADDIKDELLNTFDNDDDNRNFMVADLCKYQSFALIIEF